MGAIVALLGSAYEAADASRMLAASPHRGAESELIRHGSCVLGINRHSGCHDAELLCHRSWAAAVTGVIDNLADLYHEAFPASPMPSGFVAPLIDLFRPAGQRLLPRLRGSYVVAISDGTRLWSFRDHLGLCSLWYRSSPGGVIVASEAKQVLAGSRLSLSPDLEAIETMFFGDAGSRRPPALKGVSRLAPASVLVAGAGACTTHRYWNPQALLESARPSPDEVHEGFEHLIAQAASRALTGSDVVALSGGIDSPAVAAFAAGEHRRRTGRPLPALTAVYPTMPNVDESRFAREVTAQLGMTLHTYEQRMPPLDNLDGWVRLLDGPVRMMSVQDTAELYSTARHLGFSGVLTGELAEPVMDARRYLVGHLLRRGRVRTAVRHLRAQRARGMALTGAGRQIAAAVVPTRLASAYIHRRPTLRGVRIPDWLDPTRVKAPLIASLAPASRRWSSEQLLDIMHPDPALEADEIVQNYCGVRVRRPWADIDLWEFFLRLPAEVKFADPTSKGLVRRLLRGRVPDSVLERKSKTVFDEVAMSRIDYPALRRWLLQPSVRIGGVDYQRLATHLEKEDFDVIDDNWARDLAMVHAFVSAW